ncbi:hypothetical protein C8J56DRAFT_1007251 [Mycena floridula]|nr:hypothetical protein C8J56DRAFT_1007251 [Mycena floridula]
MYHACLAHVFTPLKPAMTIPEVIRCPDGHFRQAIYGLGPYIADYPEQVILAGIVQNWCPKGDSHPDDLNDPNELPRFDPGILWDEYGIRSDIVPFTHSFPRADIHELLLPDLLHQIIKGVFKDHIVTWSIEYLFITHGEARALEIIEDIDRRQVISAVPVFPGLQRFKDGRNFHQWTGDDSKALMKVYLAAIAGHVPSEMVQCVSAFMEMSYIYRRNAISSIFIETGVRTDISLPRQHALVHYSPFIRRFGSPNGLCSSITESKHIKSVKEPWRRSNRCDALPQMLCLLAGTTSWYTAKMLTRERLDSESDSDMDHLDDDEADDHDDQSGDFGPAKGDETSIKLAAHHELAYPSRLTALASYINQPRFPLAFLKFLFQLRHPKAEILTRPELERSLYFNGKIRVFHSAVVQFYAPSDTCGSGGMYRERIRATSQRDTVLVVTDKSEPGMLGMHVAHEIPCALINWFITSEEPDEDTGMWVVKPEYQGSSRTIQVIHLDSIARFLPMDFSYDLALDSFKCFFANKYVDHHAHEFLTGL